MKEHNDLKELLEAYEKFKDYDHYMTYRKIIDDEIDDFVASNSLALGKPEPLAKNKQTENNFGKYQNLGDSYVIDSYKDKSDKKPT